MTSVSFLVLGILLHALEYPNGVVTGLALQYVLSTLVWIRGCPNAILWMDRTVAVANMGTLGAAHANRGAPVATLLLPLLALAVFFWYKDFTHPQYGEVTRWYQAWHGSLFVFNAAIALQFRT